MIGTDRKKKSSTTWAVVLAGGAGTRLQGLYKHCPKPFIPVAGKPFIEWVFARLATLEVTNIAVAIGHRSDTAEYYLSRRVPAWPPVKIVRESRPLGTAGALLRAADELPADMQTFVVANGDAIVFGDLLGAKRRLEAEPELDGVLCAAHAPDASSFRTLRIDDAGMLREFRKKQPGPGLVNGGLYVMRRRVLAQLGALDATALEREALPKLLAAGGRWGVHLATGPLLNIDTPEQLQAAETELMSRIAIRRAS